MNKSSEKGRNGKEKEEVDQSTAPIKEKKL
jgi:hypothetical protein